MAEDILVSYYTW